MEKRLIFIASAPRSGSTWFSNLFNSHPDILYRHEPLARLAPFMDSLLLYRLKHAHGLTEKERQNLLELLHHAHPESDRPPFFPKSFSRFPPQGRFLCWAAATKWPIAGKFYEKFFSTPSTEKILVLKETGWSAHIESILDGLKPSASIFLLRHPCAIIASILRGINSGLMRVPSPMAKQEWYAHHYSTALLRENGLLQDDILKADPLTFWALRLRVLYDIFLELAAKYKDGISIVVYEDIQKEPLEETTALYSQLRIPLDENVQQFISASTGKTGSTLQAIQKKGRRSYFGVHRQRNYDPMYWKKELSTEEIEKICMIVGDYILHKFWPTHH
ncbi:MAG: sulfotransferase [Thermodesulfobacteriota bacterium]